MTKETEGNITSKLGDGIKGKLNEINQAVESGEIGLNRQQRRFLKKLNSKSPNDFVRRSHLPSKVIEGVLSSSSSLLEQDEDLNLYIDELPKYEKSQQTARKILKLYNTMRHYGVPESDRREFFCSFFSVEDKPIFPTPTANLSTHGIKKIADATLDILKDGKLGYAQTYKDSDDKDIIQLLKDNSIPVIDILNERIRVKQETIELMRMHIDWLKQHPASLYEETSPEQPNNEPSTNLNYEAIDSIVESAGEPYSLSDWQIYWTRVPWSSDHHHLLPVSTSSRLEAIYSVGKIGRHDISVKPGSIVRLLESHLRKGPLEHALASRLKYVSDDIKEWIKLKRGKDRIPLLIPDSKTAIFFVEGRDTIYRHLPK